MKTRTAIKKHGSTGFPLSDIEAAVVDAKPISVTDGFVQELASLRYGDRRTPVLLRLLFPHMVHDWTLTASLDKDHIFPISKFSTAAPPVGVSHAAWSELCDWADRLPNLQLLRKEDNRGGGKVAEMPKSWLATLTTASRKRYSRQHVHHLPDAVGDAMAFWDRRYDALVDDIRELLDPS